MNPYIVYSVSCAAVILSAAVWHYYKTIWTGLVTVSNWTYFAITGFFSPFVWFGRSFFGFTAGNVTSIPVVNSDTMPFRGACVLLAEAFKKNAFLSVDQRVSFCENSCDFMVVNCANNAQPGNMFKNFTDYVLNEAERLVNSDETIELGSPVDAAVLATWEQILYTLAPTLACLIPVLLNQYKYYQPLTAVSLMMVYTIFCVVLNVPFYMTLHNITVGIACMFYPSNSPQLFESLVGTVPLIMILLSLFIANPIAQAIMLIVIVIVYFIYIVSLFKSRRHSPLSVMVQFMQLLVLLERLTYIRNMYAEATLVGAGLDAFFQAIFPCGPSWSGFANSINIASNVVRKIPYVVGEDRAIIGICSFALHIMMFMSFRALFGRYTLTVLRSRDSFDTVLDGLLIYMCDVWGPFSCGFRMLFGKSKPNAKRISYEIMSFALMYFEATSAFDFFCCRLVFTFGDWFIVDSGRCKVTEYLGLEVDLMGQRAFPQEKALPWIDMGYLDKIKKHVDIVLAQHEKKCKGIGFAVKDGGRTCLYSVAHVLTGAKSVAFKGKEYKSPNVTKLTNSVDPIVSMDLGANAEGAPDVSIMTREESAHLAHLLFINVDDKGRQYVCCVPPDQFSVSDGRLNASVNLRQGDSGGPCFAVLTNGVIRYCGTVSSGTASHTGGNVISFCYCSEELDPDSDSDDEDSVAVRRFNEVRCDTLSDDDPANVREEAYRRLLTFLKCHKSELRSSKFGNFHLNVDRMHDQTNADFDAYITKLHVLDSPPSGSGNRTDEDVEQKQKRKNKQRKSARRDRAAWKRRVLVGQGLYANLCSVYSEKDSHVLFDVIMAGKLPNTDSTDYINGYDDGDWLYANELPGLS